jgi:AraC family L-rhamnose operon transcriptional activator RhaR
MKLVPHSPGFTLTADAFMEPGELVGFSVGRHLVTVFEHFHDFYELALVLEGEGQHVTAEGSRPVRRGSVVFIVPGVSHGWERCEDLIVYNCFVRSEAARFDIPWAQRDARLGILFAPAAGMPRQPVAFELPEDALSECHDHLEAIRLRAADERSEAFDLGHLLLALDVLAPRLGQEHVGPGLASATTPAVVRAAVRLIEHDLRRHWTLEALARELCVNVFYLVRLFKHWVGMPPVAYANQRRAERAALLLASTDDSVAAIGAQVGWPDPSQFSRRFRQAYGSGPRAYRASVQARRGQAARVAVSALASAPDGSGAPTDRSAGDVRLGQRVSRPLDLDHVRRADRDLMPPGSQ